MPRGHEQILPVFSSTFPDIFKLVMGKKILVPCFDVIMIAFF